MRPGRLCRDLTAETTSPVSAQIHWSTLANLQATALRSSEAPSGDKSQVKDVFFVGDPQSDLPGQRNRVAERPLTAGGQGPRPLPDRAVP
jgi:hypothetical protein